MNDVIVGVLDRLPAEVERTLPAERFTVAAWSYAGMHRLHRVGIENRLREVYCPLCGRHYTVLVDLQLWVRSPTVKHVPCAECQP